MKSGRLVDHSFVIMALIAAHLLAACVDRPAGSPKAREAKIAPREFREEKASQPAPSPAQPKRPARSEAGFAEIPRPSPAESGAGLEFNKIDWGREATADEMIAMAKKGQIREIEWHLMPNILRALAANGRIYFVRNENKGVDMRGSLIKAGVQVGEGGVAFRHLF